MQQECLFMLTHLLPKYLLTSYLLLSVRRCPTHWEKTCENSRQKLCPCRVYIPNTYLFAFYVCYSFSFPCEVS